MDLAHDQGRARGAARRGGLIMANPHPPPLAAYTGWSAAEIAADQALAASIQALSQADGLLNPALDPIFARRPARLGRADPLRSGRHTASPQEHHAMSGNLADDLVLRRV